MKLSNQFFYTLREDAKDEETRSGNYLVRSGMIKKVGTGIYLFMPLGLKVLKKIETIIREEMNKAGAQEVLMPSLIPEDYYIQSGRKDVFGHDMFSLKDRYNRGYVLGPTHEELFVYAAKEMIHSYKDMPFNYNGQICLPFTLLWCLLSVVAIIIDDYLRYYIFDEEKPKYKIL